MFLYRKIIWIIVPFLLSSQVPAQAPVSGPAGQELGVEQRLSRMERMLDSQGLVEMLQQLQQLQRELSMLRGEIETQNYNLEQLTRRQRDLYTDIDQRLQRLEQGGQAGDSIPEFSLGNDDSADTPPLQTLSAAPNYDNSDPAMTMDNALQLEIVNDQSSMQTGTARTRQDEESMPVTTQPGFTGVQPQSTVAESDSMLQTDETPVTAVPAGPVDPVQLQAEYQQAFNLLRQSNYDQAIRAFQQFLAIHPSDTYSDNAQYWLAEAFYVKRLFEQALEEYNKVVSNFPQSQKVNDAKLKIGFTLYELGELDAAKARLQELVDNQPGSTVARLADERIKMINSAQPQASSRNN